MSCLFEVVGYLLCEWAVSFQEMSGFWVLVCHSDLFCLLPVCSGSGSGLFLVFLGVLDMGLMCGHLELESPLSDLSKVASDADPSFREVRETISSGMLNVVNQRLVEEFV